MLLGLTTVAAGCTVHTYSGSAYPGTVYGRTETTRYEVSFGSSGRERTREQPAYRVEAHRPQKAHPAPRPAGSAAKPEPATKPASIASKPASKPASQPVKPRPSSTKASSDEREVVELMPQEPASAKRLRSVEERVGELAEQKKQAIEAAERERAARMARYIDATAPRE